MNIRTILLLTVLSTTGCVSSMIDNAMDAAQEQVRLRWAEEWRPALMEQLNREIETVRNNTLSEAVERIENFEDQTDTKLESIGLKFENYDGDSDGRLQIGEAVTLLRDIKTKNDAAGNPLSWLDILMIVIGGYLPSTAAKEFLKGKIVKKGGDNNDKNNQA